MAAKAIRQSAELELLQALQAARAAANTLIAAEKGSIERNGKIEEFDTVPFAEVQAEERRLSAAHGLLLWTDSVSTVRVDDYGSELHARFTLVHLASGASKSFEFVGPCFPLSEHNGNGAWASEATKRAWRCCPCNAVPSGKDQRLRPADRGGPRVGSRHGRSERRPPPVGAALRTPPHNQRAYGAQRLHRQVPDQPPSRGGPHRRGARRSRPSMNRTL